LAYRSFHARSLTRFLADLANLNMEHSHDSAKALSLSAGREDALTTQCDRRAKDCAKSSYCELCP
jgi:hypothetical protein